MTEDLFTAAQMAVALHRSKRSVLEALERTSPSGTKIVHGNEARAWSKDALPENILTALEDVAARRKRSIDEVLASPPLFWRPRYPLREVSPESIERASLLQRALGPVLARMNDVDLASTGFGSVGVD